MSDLEQTRAKILTAMYRSVERMNCHIVEGSLDSAASEQRLQINLRKNFEDLSEHQPEV